ncbi:MFS transporter [Spirulina major]|uniref:MFS transporter n=1 Tax=Spirulina major TaxID=270636 RepID=UPI000932221D|nr:MFS transporter [Spirulina major]
MNRQVWILALGRLLSQIGTGFTLFYAAIFFVNEVGLSATAVGLALGSQSLSGVFGRFFGGMGADSPRWGRKRIVLISALVSAVADGALALADDFPTLVLGNLLMGLGVGLYWPAAEAAVADLTTGAQRNEAFALTRLADLVGLGIGTVLAGQWIAWAGNYRMLFVIDGLSFVVFMGLVAVLIAETRSPHTPAPNLTQGWLYAVRDSTLMTYCGVNILFTAYISQIQSTLPLYLTNFLTAGGFSPAVLSGLVTFHLVLAMICQMPIARSLNAVSRWRALMISMLLWGMGFVAVWGAGVVESGAIRPALLAFSLFAVAMVTYTPAASALVVELAPPSLRGIYLSLNSQCWAMGYLVGPAVGGWAMDQARPIVDGYWLIAALTTIAGLGLLIALERHVRGHHRATRALVEQAMQTCMARDASGFAALFTDAAELVLKHQVITGRDAIAQITADYFTTCTEITITLTHLLIQSDRAELDWHWSDTKGDRANHITLDLHNGKIQRWHEADQPTPAPVAKE